MNRQEFRHTLRTRKILGNIIPFQEMSEIIQSAYIDLSIAVLQDSDSIVITKGKIEHYQDRKLIYTKDTVIDYRPSFKKILHYDQLASEHIVIDKNTSAKMVLKLIFED